MMRDWHGSDERSGSFQVSDSFGNTGDSSTAAIALTVGEANSDNAYDDDEFDDYDSESFEDDDEDPASTEAAEDDISSFAVGDRVQVFWVQEFAWFDGVVADSANGQHLITYDDGDVVWEGSGNIRLHPVCAGIHRHSALPANLLEHLSTPDALNTAAASLLGCKVAAFWPSEAAWFVGRVTAYQLDPLALLVSYDDGDTRWQLQCELHQLVVILDAAPLTQVADPLITVDQQPPAPAERVLFPRAYQAAIADHFEPMRVARPSRYVSCVNNHIGSVIAPRSCYSARRYLHNGMLLESEVRTGSRPLTCESTTQTSIMPHCS